MTFPSALRVIANKGAGTVNLRGIIQRTRRGVMENIHTRLIDYVANRRESMPARPQRTFAKGSASPVPSTPLDM
ncbi:hypothetical protein DAEQUDRAFT_532146 [Daedalea quercina L-15889]|uniref:Uncharacterized protein n=1 Tax=Daedalea quercina L-15889 TaxID=1314783 RepID=A0A165M936_9APHY|nr:hypothetical protein DAEQUDRAFT_532146 [Daedalea quercina L-15889]